MNQPTRDSETTYSSIRHLMEPFRCSSAGVRLLFYTLPNRKHSCSELGQLNKCWGFFSFNCVLHFFFLTTVIDIYMIRPDEMHNIALAPAPYPNTLAGDGSREEIRKKRYRETVHPRSVGLG